MRSFRGSLRAVSVLATAAAVIAVPVSTAGAAETSNSDEVNVIAGSSRGVVTGQSSFRTWGQTGVKIGVSAISGGSVSVVDGPGGYLPAAIQFPRYVSSGSYPRAVVNVTPTSGSAMSPRLRDFEWGSVFRLDASSSGRWFDNGDNVFQRGLSSERSMFKLEVDGGFPSCTLKGSVGQVIARANTPIARDAWYYAKCSRVGNRVSVDVYRYGGSQVAHTSAYGATGNVDFASTRPATVGGKTWASGNVAWTATDQFNGLIARAFARSDG